MGRLKKPIIQMEKPILVGEREDADYKDDLPRIYKGNPFVEALPRILRPDEVPQKLAHYPDYDESERNLPPEIRLHYVHTLEELVQPLEKHLEIERNISVMLRTGYRVRNPLTKEYAAQFYKDKKELPKVPKRSSLKGLTIIGISGIGKSTAIEQVLLTYPQVIQHVSYRGVPLILKQLVWIKIDCPYGGSSKALCKEFFRAVDAALETDYYQQYSHNSFKENKLLDLMENIIRLYGLGILVLDELQYLNVAHSGGYDKLLNFFTNLANNLGVPIVLIGTYKSLNLFSREFYQCRRGSGGGFGNILWDCMDQKPCSECKSESEWDFLLETIWKYQWTKNETPLSKNLSNVIYDESRGITAIAVMLYILAQWEAITRGGDEKITVSLIRDVAKKSLKIVRPMLQLLKLGDNKELMKIDDLKPNWIDLRDYLNHSEGILGMKDDYKKHLYMNTCGPDIEKNPIVYLIRFARDIGANQNLAEQIASQVLKASENPGDLVTLRQRIYQLVTSQNQSEPSQNKYAAKGEKNRTPMQISGESNILDIVRKGIEKKIIPYNSLLQAGYIKSPSEFYP